MMTTTATVSPTTTSTLSSTKSQSTLSDIFVKPSLSQESGTATATMKHSPPPLPPTTLPTSPHPPPQPLLLPPPLTTKLPNVDEKLIKELSQSSLLNSLMHNSRTHSSIIPGVSKPPPPPPPPSLSSGLSSSFPSSEKQQPIYVAISTNPLILVPLSYNSETGGLDLSLNNSTSVVKLPNETLLNSQLNGLIASGIDRTTLLNNQLETHRTGIINQRANLINGIDATNIINVNSLTNNHIISINNNNSSVVTTGDNVNNVNIRNLNLNNQLSQFSGRSHSIDGPLDLSSNPSSVDPQIHDKSNHLHHRHHRDNDLHSSAITSYKVKNEISQMIEESEPSPLNLFNSPSTFANLVSSAHSDLPQSTASVLAAVAAAAAVSTSPPSSSAISSALTGTSGASNIPGSAASQSTPFTPEAVFKQSSYHCEHCHIGFYKKENYTIHKRHYCSARRSQAAAAAALAAASAGSGRSRSNARTRSESSPDLLESDGSPNSSPEISLDSEKNDRNHQSSVQQSHSSASTRKSSTSRRVSVSSKTNASNSSNSPGSSPPHQPLSQYYCVACGIRFTSLDNLQAHQTYYCLKRNSVNASPDKLQYIVSIPGGTGSEVSCFKCKATYCNEEAFLSHVCSAMGLGTLSASGSKISPSQGNGSGLTDGRSSSGGVSTSGGTNSRKQERGDTDPEQTFRCTICGYKGQTLQGMRIHVRMHSQCFRCTICGYKGHTLRGMRTHVRIHQDKIQGLPEETFIACIDDEALLAKGTTRNGPTGSKRRRKSLDSYSNSSNVHNQFNLSSTISSLSNVIVSENSKPLSSQLVNNLLPSTIPSTSTSTNNNSCINDEFINSNNANNDKNSANNGNNLNSSHSEISSENEDEAISNISENEMSGRDDSRQGGSGESVHNCHLCYYSSTYKGNVVRHLKLVHKDNGGNGNGTNGPFSSLNKRDPGDQLTEMDTITGVAGEGDSHGSIADDLPLDLKATRSNGSTISERRNFRNRSPIGNNYQSAGSPIDQSGNHTNSNGSSSNNTNNGSSNSSAQTKKAVPKYCRSCDISFQFLTSFIAHKKYYCSSHSNDPNAIQPLPESKSPV